MKSRTTTSDLLLIPWKFGRANKYPEHSLSLESQLGAASPHQSNRAAKWWLCSRGHRGVRESVKWHSVTRRMPSDGRVDENSSMSSLSRDRLLAGMRRRVKSAEAPLQPQRAQMSSLFFLLFFYLLVIAVWEMQEGANTALENTKKKTQSFSRCRLRTLGQHCNCVFSLSEAGLQGPTWRLSGSSWALGPDCACTATAPPTDSGPPCRCSQLSAAPRRKATAQQTEGLKRQRDTHLIPCFFFRQWSNYFFVNWKRYTELTFGSWCCNVSLFFPLLSFNCKLLISSCSGESVIHFRQETNSSPVQ